MLYRFRPGFYPLNHYGGFNVAQLVSVAEKVAEFHAVGSAMLMRGESDGEEDVTSQFKGAEKQDFFNSVYEKVTH